MLVLGWHGHPRLREFEDCPHFAYHDAAAVILRDGRLIAAIEEERLDRVKHSNFFPRHAIRFCLERAQATLDDVDLIVTDCAEDFQDFRLLREISADPRHPRQTARQMLAATFADEFHVDVSKKLRFCKHHTAHLSSAWYPSGFSEALIVCLDGDGDGASGLIGHASRGRIETLRNLPEAQSIGNFYTGQLGFLGYQRFDEYKVMGLAPYGDPNRFAGLFARMCQLLPQGRFNIVPPAERTLVMKEAGLAGHERRKGEPFLQVHKDYSAALQRALESLGMHIVDHFRSATGSRRLCLSGGVAHNCSLNGLLLRSGWFDEMYVQPAAHDAGNALGAALAQSVEAGVPMASSLLPTVFLGSDVGSSAQIEQSLRRWAPLITLERVDNAPRAAACSLAAGEVLGWVQGRSEFGPRALGNRSILADPRPEENKRIVNAMVKKREDYRPFAPAVLEERLGDFFDVPTGTRSVPFMTIVLPVKPVARTLLGAVTHVDGSARVQSVSREQNPQFHALIQEFGRITDVPIVLNTSFNNNAEPIVDSVDDAVVTFLTTGIHTLIAGDWRVRKVEGVAAHPGLRSLVPSLALSAKLVQRSRADGTMAGFIERTSSRLLTDPSVAVSAEVFRLLLEGQAQSLGERIERCGFGDRSEQILAELFELWCARAIRLQPRATE